MSIYKSPYNSPYNSSHKPHHTYNTYNMVCMFYKSGNGKSPQIGVQYKGRPTSNRTMTFKSWSSHKNVQKLTDIWAHNLQVLAGLIQYCADNSLGLRISSDLFPLATHPSVENLVKYQEIRGKNAAIDLWLIYCSDLIKKHKVRVSMHPGQFNVLESNDPNTVNNAIKELNWHGWLLDQLGCPQNHWSPINLHIHTSKGNFYDLSGRFIKGFLRLDHNVKSRLTLENNDKGGEMGMENTPWHCENLLEFRRIAATYLGEYQIPLCFDNLHDWLLPSPNLSPEQCFHAFYNTWKWDNGNDSYDFTPIFHHSESSDPANRARSHADLPSFIPTNYGKPVHWDVELKFKDVAIKHLLTLT